MKYRGEVGKKISKNSKTKEVWEKSREGPVYSECKNSWFNHSRRFLEKLLKFFMVRIIG